MSTYLHFELAEPNLGNCNGQGLVAFVKQLDRMSCARAHLGGMDDVYKSDIETVGRMIYLCNVLEHTAKTYRDDPAHRFAQGIKTVINCELSGGVDYKLCDKRFHGVHKHVELFLDQSQWQERAGIDWQPQVKVHLVTTFRNDFEYFGAMCDAAASHYETARNTESFAIQHERLLDLTQAQSNKMNCMRDFLEYLINFVCNTHTSETRSYVETRAKSIMRAFTQPCKTKVESMEELEIEIDQRHHAYVQAHMWQLSMLRG